MKKSIFEFGDKFGVKSPFGDWVGEHQSNKKTQILLAAGLIEDDGLSINQETIKSEPRNNIIPPLDKLIYYKFDFKNGKWWGFNNWRVNKYPQWGHELIKIAQYGIKIRQKVKNEFGLVDTNSNDGIIFSYNENDGELPSFKLNMDYISKTRKKRHNLKIPFYSYEFGEAKYGNFLIDIDWSEITDIHTNCYADAIDLVGTIDYQEVFLDLLAHDGYKFKDYKPSTKARRGDILILMKHFHAMKVIDVDSSGRPTLYRSNNRNMERRTDTFDEINFWQFNETLDLKPPIVLASK